jgi:hypothetical protein
MGIHVSWLRRVWRTVRVCVVSGVLLVAWSSIEGAVSLMRPIAAGPALLLLGALFVWWH